MGVATRTVSLPELWGSVCRRFGVSYRDRERGRVVESRPPNSRDVTGVEVAGGIVRMPARHSSRLSSSPKEAA